MDFIERLFGVSPDGGSGSVELLLVAGPILLVAYWVLRNRGRKR